MDGGGQGREEAEAEAEEEEEEQQQQQQEDRGDGEEEEEEEEEGKISFSPNFCAGEKVYIHSSLRSDSGTVSPASSLCTQILK
eukprot:138865-Hanusia_phi.AAC.1